MSTSVLLESWYLLVYLVYFIHEALEFAFWMVKNMVFHGEFCWSNPIPPLRRGEIGHSPGLGPSSRDSDGRCCSAATWSPACTPWEIRSSQSKFCLSKIGFRRNGMMICSISIHVRIDTVRMYTYIYMYVYHIYIRNMYIYIYMRTNNPWMLELAKNHPAFQGVLN